jgi:hypothetical protein
VHLVVSIPRKSSCRRHDLHSVRPMHFARVSHTATLLSDGRVLVVGGRGDRVNAVAEIYDQKRSGSAKLEAWQPHDTSTPQVSSLMDVCLLRAAPTNATGVGT